MDGAPPNIRRVLPNLTGLEGWRAGDPGGWGWMNVWLHKTYCRFSLVLSSGRKTSALWVCLFVLLFFFVFWIDLVFVEKLLSNFSLKVCQIKRRENTFVPHLVTLKISLFQMLSVFLLRTSTKPEGQALSPEQATYLIIFIFYLFFFSGSVPAVLPGSVQTPLWGVL